MMALSHPHASSRDRLGMRRLGMRVSSHLVLSLSKGEVGS